MAEETLSLETINALDRTAFLAALRHIFEHSPGIADAAWLARPFLPADRLHDAMMEVVRGAPEGQQVALLCAHPELAGREAQDGTLTTDSTSEQSRLGFNALKRDELERMAELNRAYRETF